MQNILEKIKGLPTSPGVYIFKNNKEEILYVGKAASLKDRVRSYFQGVNYFARPIDFAIDQIFDLEIKKTETVLEAYFLEQELIKRYKPKYNVLGKDDKSFIYVCLTKEEFPRFDVKRKTDIEKTQNSKFKSQNYNSKIKIFDKKNLDFKGQFYDTKTATKYKKVYGPYTSRYLIEQALRILRKIFPYHNKPQKTEKGCMDYHLGLCPGPYAGMISKEDYQKNIKSIEMILQGKKKSLLRKLEKEMHELSEKQEFEKAAKTRNLIFTLRHIQDVAMIREHEGASCQLESAISTGVVVEKEGIYQGSSATNQIFRIEGYDISNISGKYAVGSMVVFDNEQGYFIPNKNEYRKFRVKTLDDPNDVGAMEEVLRRRFKNSWKLPNLILLDGGKGHLNMARRVLRDYHYNIPILAIAKGPKRDKLDQHYYGTIPKLPEKVIAQVRDEAHRFAISYHRKLRSKIV